MERSKKRTRQEKREGIQNALERHRRFDYDYIPFGTWTIPDEHFCYRQGAWDRFWSGAVRTLLFVAAPILLAFGYGCRVVGRKNLRALKGKGAICISNHFHYLDTLFARAAIGQYRGFYTMAPWNNKTGVGGWFMRHAGMWPFSPNLGATRNLQKEMERQLKRGKIVHFYPEQAMWGNYQKPRPMKDGAFFYALKFHVPVLPVFCTFKKSKKGYMRRVVVHILPAIWPDESLPRAERLARFRAQAEEAWKACYEQAYGIPLTWLPDVRQN